MYNMKMVDVNKVWLLLKREKKKTRKKEKTKYIRC